MRDFSGFLNQMDERDLHLLRAALDARMNEKTAGRDGLRALSSSFSVPAETRHLTSEQLEMTARAFLAWYKAGKTPAHRRSRGRIWLAFLLIRYAGLRLGEVLALDDRQDIDTRNGVVRIREGAARAVKTPESVLREITDVLESPMFYSLRGSVLRLDEGYLRRKFYERAKDCGLPATLLNPRAIRHSRAIELVRGGVPMPVVRAFLGQSNVKQSSGYMEFSDDTVEQIVQTFLNRELRMKTSARNTFCGTVTCIRQDGLLAEAAITTTSGLVVTAVITGESLASLGLVEGGMATATVKASWVLLITDGSVKTSARNAYAGKVRSVELSEIAAEVTAELHEGSRVCALITRESADALQLEPGRDVTVMFKAFAVVLNVE